MSKKTIPKKSLVCWTKKEDNKVICVNKSTFKNFKPKKTVVKKSPLSSIKKITSEYEKQLELIKEKILTFSQLKKRFKNEKQSMRNYLRKVASDYNDIVKKFNSQLKEDMKKITATEFNEITLGTRVLQQQITSSISRRLKTINNN